MGAPSYQTQDDEILALHEAMTRFEAENPARAAVAKLRYFAGLSMEQTADVLGVPRPSHP